MTDHTPHPTVTRRAFIRLAALPSLAALHEGCRRWALTSQTVRELRPVVQAYDQPQKEELRLSHQLRNVLKPYYPVATDLFSKLPQPLTRTFLRAFPSPQAAQAASRQDLVDFFVAQRDRWLPIIWTLWQRRGAYDEAKHVANRERRGFPRSVAPLSFTA